MATELHDSGERQSFDTGAVRDTATGKPRPALISPYFTERLAAHLSAGALKYKDRNWEKGIPITRCLDSLERHLIAFKKRESGEDHLAAAACNLMFITHFDSLGTMDDRPHYGSDVQALREKQSVPPVTAPLEGTIEEPLKIYVAGPYTKGIVKENLERARGISLLLAKTGHLVHCPHAATEHLSDTQSYEWFMQLDISLIKDWATALYRMPGESPGADREESVAQEKGIPIFRRLSEVPNLADKAPGKPAKYRGISSTP